MQSSKLPSWVAYGCSTMSRQRAGISRVLVLTLCPRRGTWSGEGEPSRLGDEYTCNPLMIQMNKTVASFGFRSELIRVSSSHVSLQRFEQEGHPKLAFNSNISSN